MTISMTCPDPPTGPEAARHNQLTVVTAETDPPADPLPPYFVAFVLCKREHCPNHPHFTPRTVLTLSRLDLHTQEKQQNYAFLKIVSMHTKTLNIVQYNAQMKYRD